MHYDTIASEQDIDQMTYSLQFHTLCIIFNTQYNLHSFMIAQSTLPFSNVFLLQTLNIKERKHTWKQRIQ